MISRQKKHRFSTLLNVPDLCFLKEKGFADFNVVGVVQAVFTNQKNVFAHTYNFPSCYHQGCWYLPPCKTISLQNLSAKPKTAEICNNSIDKKLF